MSDAAAAHGTDAAPVTPERFTLERIAELYSRPGPFLTVYLDSAGIGTDPGHELEVRWRNLRRQAEDDDGAPAEVLDAAEAAVLGSPLVEARLVVVANESGVLLCGDTGVAAGSDLAVWQELPRLAPVLAWEGSLVPYVIVLTDRVGADISVVDRESLIESSTVDGSDVYISRSAPGGWSQRRFQQRAENSWEHNAAEVAREVTAYVDEVGAAFIAVAGDVRAVQLLEEQLDERLRPLVREVRGGRQPGDDLDGAAEDVLRLQDTAAAELTVATLDDFAERRATAGAVDGVDATFESLQRGLVRHLLVVDDLAPRVASQHCWISDEPMLVATQGGTIRSLGHPARRAPLVDAAVRAALAQGAKVSVVPAHGPNSPRGGVGALLRG